MHDVIIIGKGPAGISAGIYTSRATLKTLVIGKESKMNNPHHYENYFGFPDAISGKELIERGEKQIEKFGVEIKEESVISVKKENFFKVETEKSEYEAKALIIATGVPFKNSGIKNEKEYSGKGLSNCVVCDGFFFKNKKCAVVGNTDFVAHEAIELSNYTSDITIFTQGENLNISAGNIEKLKKRNIRIRNEKVEEIKGEMVEALVINGKEEKFDGVFVAMGTASALDFAKTLGIEIQDNFIKTDKEMRTGIEGAYAAGDCTGGFLQLSVAVGEGAVAAKSAIGFLTK